MAGPTVITRVPGFPAYGVDTNGVIWSYWKSRGPGARRIADVPQKRIVGAPVGDGRYLQVALTDGSGNRTRHQYQVVVLMTLVGSCPTGHQARHLDGDSRHNHPSNLAWGTPLENMADKQRHGTTSRGERHPKAVLTESIVRRARKLRGEGKTLRQIADALQVNPKTITAAIYGHSWRHVQPEGGNQS